MRSRLWIACALLGVSLVGCNSAEKDELAVMKDKNAELQTELDRTKTALDGSESSRRALEEENARMKMAGGDSMAGANSTTGEETKHASKMKDLPPGVTAHVEGTSVVIDIPGDVLFDSGKNTLKTDAKKTLDQIAKSVKASYPGKKLSVEGFTDTDPIKKSKYSDNWELAYERARAVGKYLVGKGFSESQFRYVSYGPSDPKSSKKESRRVELAIVDAAN